MKKFDDLNKDQQDDMLNELAETLIGCIAMDSVVLDRINWVAEKFGVTEFEGYDEALELLQVNQVECDECPQCGWFSEGNFYEHHDHEGVCHDCEEEE